MRDISTPVELLETGQLPRAIDFFENIRSEKGVFGFIGELFAVATEAPSFSPIGQNTFKKVLERFAPNTPEDVLEKYYEFGSAKDCFYVFEMFVEAGYPTSWQWGSSDLLMACCLSGSPRYLYKMLERQRFDAPVVLLASLNPNPEMFEEVLSRFDKQELLTKMKDLYDWEGGGLIQIVWGGSAHTVNANHVQKVYEKIMDEFTNEQQRAVLMQHISAPSFTPRKKI